MIGDNKITVELYKAFDEKPPDFIKIRGLIVKAFNKETESNFEIKKLNHVQEEQILKWLNKHTSQCNPVVLDLLYKKGSVLLPFFSPSLSYKINTISQYDCPICEMEDAMVVILPIRITAISKQASKSKIKTAFKKALEYRFRNDSYKFIKGKKLCIHAVFVLGKKTRDKDLDNMSKALMDALQGNLFDSDIDIQHLSLMKIFHSDEEDYIMINIRESSINSHNNVFSNKLAHGWGNQGFLDLEKFL